MFSSSISPPPYFSIPKSEPVVLTQQQASDACESLSGMNRYIQYAKLRGMLSRVPSDTYWGIQEYFPHIVVVMGMADTVEKTVQELGSVGLSSKEYAIIPYKNGPLEESLKKRLPDWTKDREASAAYSATCYQVVQKTIQAYRSAKAMHSALLKKEYSQEEFKESIARIQKYSSVLILRGNIGFGKVPKKLHSGAMRTGYGFVFHQAMQELHEVRRKSGKMWDMLNFMPMNEGVQITAHLATLKYAPTSTACAIQASVYNQLEKMVEGVEGTGDINPMDHIFASLHKKGNSFGTIPSFVYSRSLSQHWQGEVDLGKANEKAGANKRKKSMLQYIQKKYFEDKSLDHNWRLQDYFGSIVVISLPNAEERRRKIREALAAIGIEKSEFEFFRATDGRKELDGTIVSKMHMNWAKIDTSTAEGEEKLKRQFQGEAGCYVSHTEAIKMIQSRFLEAQKMLEKAKKRGNDAAIKACQVKVKKCSSVLLLEDDTGFGLLSEDSKSATVTRVGSVVRRMLQELPQDWQMFYFNALARGPCEKISRHIVRSFKSDYLNAYAVNHTFYQTLLDTLNQIYDPKVTKVDPVDTAVQKLHADYQCYAAYPPLAYQGGDVSSITSDSKALNQKWPDEKGMIKNKKVKTVTDTIQRAIKNLFRQLIS